MIISANFRTYRLDFCTIRRIAVIPFIHRKQRRCQRRRAVNTTSFYGPISFAADGSIAGKPMFTQQRQGTGVGASYPIVAPPEYATAALCSYR